MDKYVYHSSKTQGLKVIKPNKSTHHESWVYAATTIEMSALFLSPIGGDLTCQVGREKVGGIAHVVERFKGAFEYRYKGKSGSIYILSSEGFKQDQTGWLEEVVAENEVRIEKEIIIEDVYEFLLNLADEGKLEIIRFPEKPDWMPCDDEDLVMRGIVWTREFGDRILTDFEKWHPHLMHRIKEGLKENRYKNGFEMPK